MNPSRRVLSIRTLGVLLPVVLAVTVLAACAATTDPVGDPTSAPSPSATEDPALARTASSPIAAAEAYAMCRASAAKWLVFDPARFDQIQSFDDARITAEGGAFTVKFDAPVPDGFEEFVLTETACTVTGTLGDPRFLFPGSQFEVADQWVDASGRPVELVIDEETEIDPQTPLDELTAWAICNAVRLSQEPVDFAADWPGFESAQISRGPEGLEIYETYPSGIAQTGPQASASFCVVDGTLGEQWPIVYFSEPTERLPDDPNPIVDPRDRYADIAPMIHDLMEP